MNVGAVNSDDPEEWFNQRKGGYNQQLGSMTSKSSAREI